METQGTTQATDTAPPSQGASVSPDVALLRCKVPEFYSADPTAWFLGLETLFDLYNVKTEATKCKHLIGSLPTSILAHVQDVCTDLSQATPYSSLKTVIIKRFSDSKEEKLRKLLLQQELAVDEKPSQFLRTMKGLAGYDSTVVDSSLFKEAFFSKLPPTVRAVLATCRHDSTVSQLADKADEILEATSSQHMFGASAISSVSSLEEQVKSLQVQLENLTARLNQDAASAPRPRRNFHSYPRSPSRSRPSRPRTPPIHVPQFCFYHTEFGRRARKCQPPCSFPTSEN